MARPRKDSASPSAQQRLIDAFWELLKTYKVHEITISMLCGKIGCNRGTFYYHFENIDNLLQRAIEFELIEQTKVTTNIFTIMSREYDASLCDLVQKRNTERLYLVMKQGGREKIESIVKKSMLRMWSAVLCPAPSESLTPASRLIIEYSIGGILSSILFIHENVDEPAEIEFCDDTISQIIELSICELTKQQNVSREELSTRVKAAFEFSNMSL